MDTIIELFIGSTSAEFMTSAISTAVALAISAAIAAASAGAQAGVQKKASDERKRYNRERQRSLDSKEAQDNAWYRMQYYRDPLRTSSGANMLETIREYNDSLLRRQQARNVITGGTQESELAALNKMAENYGNTVSSIKAKDDERRDKIGEWWRRNDTANWNRQQDLDESIQEQRQETLSNTKANINNFADVAMKYVADSASLGTEDTTTPSSNAVAEEASKPKRGVGGEEALRDLQRERGLSYNRPKNPTAEKAAQMASVRKDDAMDAYLAPYKQSRKGMPDKEGIREAYEGRTNTLKRTNTYNA